MSLFKSLILAIVATFLITYMVGTSAIDLLDIDIVAGADFHGETLDSLSTISFSALATLMMMFLIWRYGY